MKRYNPLTVLLSSISLLFIFSCSTKDRETDMEIAEKYLLAYSSGTIQRSSPIRITFNSPVSPATELNIPLERNPFKISPSVAGQAFWEDHQTLVYKPDALLPVNTSFKASLQLNQVHAEIPSNVVFNFNFSTRPQSIDVEFVDFHLENSGASSLIEAHFLLRTADVAAIDEVKNAFTFEYDKSKPEIQWEGATTGTSFLVKVTGLDRMTKATDLIITWDGKPISSKDKGKLNYSIPGKDDFIVWSARVVPEEESHIFILFSDPVDPNQDLDGLISLQNYTGQLRFLREENKVRVYHQEDIQGIQTLSIAPTLRSQKGKTLGVLTKMTLDFVPVVPQVRLAGLGNILAEQDNKYILPVEVLNLHSVEVEVFKIFSNNVLQYMHFEEYESQWEMRKVGRVVHREVIRLDVSNDVKRSRYWQRYGVDITHMIEADPQSLLQVRIGFRPEHVTLPCAASLDAPVLSGISEEGGNELASMFDDYYGLYGYNYKYNWNNRKDPCSYEYYNRENFVSRTLIPTNLGLMAKKTEVGEWMLIATYLNNASPASGVEINFFDYQQQMIKTLTTDASGIVRVKLSSDPFVVTGKKGLSRAILKLKDGANLQMSRFDIAGVSPGKGIKGFIYGERDVWRPGDSLHLYCIVEHELHASDIPLVCEIFDPRGVSVSKFTPLRKSGPMHYIGWATTPDAITGDYRMKVNFGPAVFTRTLKIENIKPNRLKVDYRNVTEKVTSKRKFLEGTLSAEWLHGASAAGMKVAMEMLQQNTTTTFKGFDSYVFDDPSRKPNFSVVSVHTGRLDGNGEAKVSYQLDNSQILPGHQLIRLKTTVEEESGDFSLDQQTIEYSPFATYAGIQLPQDRYKQNRLPLGENASISFVVLNEDGKPAANQQVELGLYEVGWRWWWDSYDDYIQGYATSTHSNAIERYSLTTDRNGKATLSVKIDNWGRYLIRACLPASGHCSGDFFYCGYPWYDDQSVASEASILSVSVSKEKYAPGEEVQLMIPSSAQGRALVTLENGSRVVRSFWQDIVQGNNTLTFSATEEMAPNVYANIALIQPHEGMSSAQPLRMYGAIPIMVEDPESRLVPVIRMDDTLEGDKEFTIEISESSGRDMHYSIAVVDEGLLGLTRFATPDPHKRFFAKEALGVWTWDYFDKVLGRYAGESGRIMSIGGDAEVRVEGSPQSSRFPPVVMQSGPRFLTKGKKDKVTMRMPNYAGAVRVMVIAADHRKYGHSEKSVKVRKPLMVLATLPRTAGTGETFTIPVNLFSLEKKIKNVSVTIQEKNGLSEFPSGTKFSATFDASGEKMVYIPVKTKNAVGTAHFIIEAKGNGHEARYEVHLPVRNANVVQSKSEVFVLNKSETLDKKFEPIGMPGTNKLDMEVSITPPINLTRHLKYLMNYPYGCLEQTISIAYPQMFLADVMELDHVQKARIANHIRVAIDKVNRHVLHSGGLSNWPGGFQPDYWISAYVIQFILDARENGYQVSESLYQNLLSFIKQTTRNWKPPVSGEEFYRSQEFLNQAYRLNILAKANSPDLASMNMLKEHKGLDNMSKWILAGAYAHSGRKSVAKKIISGLPAQFYSYPDQGYTYGSELRDLGLILEQCLYIGEVQQAALIAKDISDGLSKDTWYSTQTLAQVLKAMAKYYKTMDKAEGLQFVFKPLDGKRTSVKSDKNLFYFQSDIAGNQSQNLFVENLGKGPLYVRVLQSGIPAAGQEEPAENGLRLNLTYRTKSGQTIQPESIEQGQEFELHVLVNRTQSGSNMDFGDVALAQVFPPGWEIINTRMDFMQNTSSQRQVLYQDIRDDRVLTYLNLKHTTDVRLVIPLRATYAGRYYLPAHRVETMYNNRYYAQNKGEWIEVVRKDKSM
jgi:alpha-2-macroglobulin